MRNYTPSQLNTDYAACLAEIAVSRLTNMCWTGCGRGDGTVPAKDVGDTYQVRSTITPGYGLMVRPADQGDDLFVLVQVSTDTRVCVALGFRSADEARQLGRPHGHDGPHPCWIVSPSQLRPWAERPFDGHR